MSKNAPIVAAMLAILLVNSATVTLACTCSLDASRASQRVLVTRARRDATVVLAGTVLEVERGMIGVVPAHYYLVRMKVDRVWKGQVGGEVVVQTGLGSGDCGYRFEVGHGYLVYGWGEGDSLQTNICTRTRNIAQAASDIKLLGRARKPTRPKTMPNNEAMQQRRPQVFGCSEVVLAYNAFWLFGALCPFAGAAPLIADVIPRE